MAKAYQWYEEKRPGLGDELLLCVDAAMEQVLRLPEMFPVVHRNVRRALIRRFPFSIFYTVEPSRILVLAFFHGRRDPNALKTRH